MNIIIRTFMDTVLEHARYARARLKTKAEWIDNRRSHEKHILMLAWFFPPFITGGVYRPLSFVREANERGWKVTVISGPEPSEISAAGSYLASRIPPSVRLMRVPHNTSLTSYRLFPRIDGGFCNITDTLNAVMKSDIDVPSVIFASGPPFHNFVVGLHLARGFSRPLVLDYRDEWTDCPFEFVERGSNDAIWEEKCLAHATRVIYTTKSFKDKAKDSFPSVDYRKFSVLANGFEQEELNDSLESCPTHQISPEKITISFLGTLGPHAPADAFLRTLAELVAERPEWRSRLSIQFIGQRQRKLAENIGASPLASVVTLVDQVSKPEALAIMRNSDALLLFNPEAMQRYLPGKIFEYVATGTPILCYGDGGEIAAVVRNLEAGVVIADGDKARLHESLVSIAAGRFRSNRSQIEEWLRVHERRFIAGRLLDELESIIADKVSPT